MTSAPKPEPPDLLLNHFYQRALARAQYIAGEYIGRAIAKFAAEQIYAFTRLILHGDEEHQRWLTEAAREFIRTGTVTRKPKQEEPKP